MVTEVNINNMKRISKERIRALIKASCASKHIKKLSLANTAISDQEARVSVLLFQLLLPFTLQYLSTYEQFNVDQ